MTIKKSKTLAALLTCLTITAALFTSCDKNPVDGRDPLNNDTIINPNPRRPPVANAGPDKTITILNQYVFHLLDGSASTGVPLKFAWRQLSGPAVPIHTPENVQTSVGTFSIAGVYSFELKVENTVGVAYDTVQVVCQYLGDCPSSRTEIPVGLTYIADLPHVQIPEMFVAGNKLVFPAWFDNQTGIVSNKIYVYDLVTRSWSTIFASLARYSACTVVAGNKILFAGGFDVNSNPVRVVDIYDFTTNTWSTHQLSEARGSCSGVLSGNKVYFAGGMDNSQALSRKIDIYDLQANTWTTDVLPTTGRVSIAAIAVQDKVLFCGGYTRYDGLNYNAPSPIIEIYHPATNSWSLDSLTLNKVEFSAIAVNNKLFFAGGLFEQSATFHVERRDLASLERTSSCLHQPMVPFNNNSAVVKNDRILFYYNSPFSGLQRNKFDIYNWQTNTWSIGVMPLNLIPEHAGTAMAIAGQQVYIVIEDKLYLMGI